MESYHYWKTYIAGGRSKTDRPIGNSRTKRAFLYSDGRIGLRLHYTDVVTLYPDGTEVINTGGWDTVTTKRFLNENSKAHVWSEKGQLYVYIATPTITAPRVQKCRQCKGTGEIPNRCYGPGWCYVYGYRPCEHGQTVVHRKETCYHGKTDEHELAPVECYQCHGTGRFDYGSREVHYAWDGEPLRITENGQPVGPVQAEPTTVVVSKLEITHGSATPYTDYRDSGSLLSATLPDLKSFGDCPHCSRDDTIDNLIIHLNDAAHWTREQIADWLDTLDVNLTFPVPDTIPAHIH